MSETVHERLKKQISDNKIILFMKGTPSLPQCGFSAQVVQILSQYIPNFTSVNVLEDLEARRELPVLFDWPTFPQLYVKGELIGGCDIVTHLHETQQLKKVLEAAS